jgi:excisionase family DNA binding protein
MDGRGIDWMGEVRRLAPGCGPVLLDYAQLAEWLNDSVRHLRRLVNEERIPYIKIGHFVRFDPVQITEWLDAHRRGVA